MALYASLTVYPTNPVLTTMASPVQVMLVVTNPGASAVNILDITPFATVPGSTARTESVAFSKPWLGPGVSTSVAANYGTLTFRFPATCFAPGPGDGGSNPGTIVYQINASILASDGTYAAPISPCAISVVPYDGRQRAGSVGALGSESFGTGSYGPGVTQQTTPAIPAVPALPATNGALLFYYWPNSALLPVLVV